MIAKDFLNAVAHGRTDVIQLMLGVLKETGAAHCVIGGLAVNADAEPVVSLDVDLVVVSDKVDAVCAAARSKGMKVERFAQGVNLLVSGSDLRVQLQTDPRHQEFISRASECEVLGYRLSVAAVADVLQGKVWAHADEARRRSKRQKDLADIARLVEAYPELKRRLPPEVRSAVE